ncbi:hypothetical protein GGR52DRAFT_487737 [Hypoxylon sp. FL1284]|nr:hypothetical protein GGR52DRAFT_487737 [Hypoxylon sp. FL1284]
MTAPLLFCVDEEAKPFVYRVMDVKLPGVEKSLFNLVERRGGPVDEEAGFKRALRDADTFESDFIGTSEQDCQVWAMEMQRRYNFIEQDIIGIVDARSALDGTLLVQSYSHEPGLEIGEEGILPKENNTWHSFRIEPQHAPMVYSSLQYGALEVVYPVYFGRKQELTDERGVFDVARAERICCGEES